MIVLCQIIGVLHYCRLVNARRYVGGKHAYVNQANRAKKRWATVIGKNEVLEQMGHPAVKNRTRSN